MRPSSFGRGLSLVTLGLVVLPLLVREGSVETQRSHARFALPFERALERSLVTIRRTRPAATEPVPSEVVLRVNPLPAPKRRAAEPPPPAPPPYPLIIPVAGVRPQDLTDTFGAPRDSTRTHRAIDILAPTGTPVVAAVGGHVIRTHTSALGGLTVYQVGPDSAWVFYYAHLDRYADGLRPGMAVAQGDTLGYVGETGNAPIPHLHFAVWKALPGSTRLWGGRAVNPYPLLSPAEPPRRRVRPTRTRPPRTPPAR